MKEKLMQELIVQFPSEILEEPGLTYFQREVNTGNNRLDIVLLDRRGRHVLVEVQSGSLDTKHIDRHIDYSEGYLGDHPKADIRILYVANHIDIHRKTFLQRRGHEFKEISEVKFKEVALANEYSLDRGLDMPEKSPEEPLSIAPAEVVHKTRTNDDLIYIRFWNQLSELSLQRKSNLRFRVNNTKDQWYRDIDIGFSGASVCLTVHKKPLEVTFDFQIRNSPALYERLQNRKTELMNRLNCHLKWIANPDHNIRKIRTSQEANILEHTDWGPHLDWLLQTAERFQQVFIDILHQRK
jgi:hypothetical protein